MKKSLFLMAIATVAISSCSSDETLQVNRGNSIEFRAAMGTRGTETNLGTIQSGGFAVTALNADKTDEYFENVSFTTTDNQNYNSATQYYWPNNGTALNFYAWYPSNKFSTYTSSGSGIGFEYTVDKTIASQVDVIVANEVDKTKPTNTTTGVPLQFKHALSQIDIKAKNTNKAYNVKVKKVKIANVHQTGTFTVATEGTTSNTNTLASYVGTEINKTLGSAAETMFGNGDGCAMLIPQTLTSWDVDNDKTNTGNKAFIALLVDIDAAGGAQIYPETIGEYAWAAVPMPTTYNWERNNKYTYLLDFSNGAGFVAPDEKDDAPAPDGSDGTGDNWNNGDEIIDTDYVIFFASVSVEPWDSDLNNDKTENDIIDLTMKK